MIRKPKRGTTKATGRVRDYGKEYADYHGKASQIAKRGQRNQARATMVAAGKVKPGDGKTVEHKNPIRDGGTNRRSNLAVMSESKNKGWRKGKKNYG